MSDIIIEYDLLTAEKYYNLIQQVRNLNKKVWEVAEPRYQFNMKLEKNNLKTFLGNEMYFYEALSAENFCFRPEFYIKRELYDDLTKKIKDEIKIGYNDIDFKMFKQKDLFFYNTTSIYDKINLGKKVEHCKVMVSFDNYVVEIPPIGTSSNGIPFFEDKQPDEAQTSGFWIEGTAIKFFINTFSMGTPKNIKIKVFYKEL